MEQTTIDQDLQNASVELDVPIEELVAIPSLGTDFTNLNKRTNEHLNSLIFSKSHELVSMKTSDVRYTRTFKDRDNSIEIDDSIMVDWRGEAIRPTFELLIQMRFGAMNFFPRPGKWAGIYKIMIEALNAKIAAEGHQIDNETREIIETVIKQRITNGTAFIISSMVTRNKETGMTINWHRAKAEGMYKMTMYEFKEAACRRYKKVSRKNQPRWMEIAGDLWHSNCISVIKDREDFSCAFLEKGKY
jgi:hypothetical protein